MPREQVLHSLQQWAAKIQHVAPRKPDGDLMGGLQPIGRRPPLLGIILRSKL
ncbi:hypothetical protein LX32DRAFT_636050 [Colletotrichum zoysiae]|uniref:Uncharacterized protein n=1 Tax=Colletotrichum zoysiae TaxID=1216348 RepID=A0AAD9M8J0_9PEZI|nr:hypothetical protein LX32DRAFT_636050 [Colletotrichum zoysiae]